MLGIKNEGTSESSHLLTLVLYRVDIQGQLTCQEQAGYLVCN
jgi:hypothetical protein